MAFSPLRLVESTNMDLQALVEIDLAARRHIHSGRFQEAESLYHSLIVETKRELSILKVSNTAAKCLLPPKPRFQVTLHSRDVLGSDHQPPNAFILCENIFGISAVVSEQDPEDAHGREEEQLQGGDKESLLVIMSISLYNVAMICIWLNATTRTQLNHTEVLRAGHPGQPSALLPQQADRLSRALSLLKLVVILVPSLGNLDKAQRTVPRSQIVADHSVQRAVELAAINNCAFIHSLRCDFASVETYLDHLFRRAQEYVAVSGNENELTGSLWDAAVEKILYNFCYLRPSPPFGAPTA
jgi:hypothetical protein